jgi:GTP-binding protein Era
LPAEDPAGGAFRCGVVAVSGRPNVGKSTLVNAIVGQKVSIVSPTPQTTRNRISGIACPPNAQIVLLDTPGIHKPHHRLNEKMVEAAVGSFEHVDVIYVVAEADGIGPGDRFVISLLERSGAGGPPAFLVLNKIDRIERKPDLLPVLESSAREFPWAEMIPISARTGENVDRLVAATVARLPAGPPLFPQEQVSDQPERFLASEIVREKICLHTKQELPHETAVLIESWSEREDGLVRIEAQILCEKESQKGIVIGRDGSLLKRIGTEARVEIETLLACRVFLGLRVRVHPEWREDPRVLKRIGLA